jgi:hypothetical protein
MKSLIQNLPPKHCICIHDYSENYRCVEKNEIQSNYFQRTECSLHVTIIHKHAILEYDGLDSTDDFPIYNNMCSYRFPTQTERKRVSVCQKFSVESLAWNLTLRKTRRDARKRE